MRVIAFTTFVLLSVASYSQSTLPDSLRMTISPAVNQQDSLNQKIIFTLNCFLNSKDSSNTHNKYWSNLDFEKYSSPYFELEGIEKGRLGKYFYQPLLMEIIPTNKENRKIIKVAYIGHNNTTHDNIIKAIYNMVAITENDNIVLSKYLNFATESWKVFSEGSIRYKISPNKTISKEDIRRQKEDIKALCNFFNTKPIAVTYFSCRSPKEVFELKGFEYHSMMYADTSGGFSQERNIVLSGNNSEYYTHEITHLYLANLFPTVNSFLNEGFATYAGGSGKYDYKWQRNKFRIYLIQNPGFQFTEHLDDPYERLYFEHETPIPYMVGALVCERTIRLYGKTKLFELFKSEKSISEKLEMVGLTKVNINEELKKESKLSPTLILGK